MGIVTAGVINALRTGYSRHFQEALSKAPSHWAMLATRLPSTDKSNTYGWLGQFPKLREWVGDRVFNDTVFLKDMIPYGIRYRCNGGYGFWQQAVKSTNPLDTDTFKAALLALQGGKADGGRPLNLGFGGEAGTMLVVPPVLQAVARQILMAERNEAGASNIWLKAATLFVSPWLA